MAVGTTRPRWRRNPGAHNEASSSTTSTTVSTTSNVSTTDRIAKHLDRSIGHAINLDAFDDNSVYLLQRMRAVTRYKRVLIDPRSSRLLPYWDMLTALALLYVAIFTPFEVAFLDQSTMHPGFFVVNRLLDLIFIVDMLLQFFVAFPITREEAGGKWATRVEQTAWHYAKGWFTLDLLTIMPSIFDVIPLAAATQHAAIVPAPAGGRIGDPGSGTGLRNFAGLRVMRVLRLLKMVRLIRVSRLIKRWSTDYPIPFAWLTVLELSVLILMTTHWFGCSLGLVASLRGNGDLVATWFATHGYCFAQSGIWDGCGSSAGTRYFASVEWGLGLVTGLETYPQLGSWTPYCMGYLAEDPQRDPDCLSRLNRSERAMRLVLLMVGALLWSYVVARFVDVIVQSAPDAKAFRASVDELNRFVDIHGLERPLARRLREYLIKAKHVGLVKSYQRVYQHLSPTLRSEVAVAVHRPFFRQIRLLGDANESLRAHIARMLHGAVFAPSEHMPRDNVYHLHRGIALLSGVVMGSGRVWGVSSVMYSAAQHAHTEVVAFTYCEVLCINGLVVRELAETHDPPTARRIKTWAAFEALKMHILRNFHRTRRNQDATGMRMLRGISSRRTVDRPCNADEHGAEAARPSQRSIRGVSYRDSSASAFGGDADGAPCAAGGVNVAQIREMREMRAEMAAIHQLLLTHLAPAAADTPAKSDAPPPSQSAGTPLLLASTSGSRVEPTTPLSPQETAQSEVARRAWARVEAAALRSHVEQAPAPAPAGREQV